MPTINKKATKKIRKSPKNWLNNATKNKHLVHPIELATKLFEGWDQNEVKKLWIELKEILDTYQSMKHPKFKDSDYHMLLSFVIFQTNYWEAWDNFLNRWKKKLEKPLNDFNAQASKAYAEVMGQKYEPEPTWIIKQKRLCALVMMHAISQNDVIQARDVFWHIIYMKDPLESHNFLVNTLSARASKAAISSQKQKGYKKLKEKAIQIYTQTILNHLSKRQAAQKIAPAIKKYAQENNLIKLSPDREIVTISGWLSKLS